MIVGISGYKGSGKDTFADLLVKNYEYQKLSFAAKLKESASKLLNVDQILFEDWKNDKDVVVTISKFHKTVNRSKPITFREFLQRYGTEAHRDVFGEDFWVNEALKGVATGNYVLPDCRFENEAKRIKSLDGVIVRINRYEQTDDGHASEQLFHNWLVDYWVDNTGNLEDLEREVDEFIAWLQEENYEEQYG